MLTLALDVDGVLLDPDRNGEGHWSNELAARFGIERGQLREAFFMPSCDDVVSGRQPIEDGLGDALNQIGATADVDCRAQPCLIVFLVVDPTFAIIDGSALALRATEAAR